MGENQYFCDSSHSVTNNASLCGRHSREKKQQFGTKLHNQRSQRVKHVLWKHGQEDHSDLIGSDRGGTMMICKECWGDDIDGTMENNILADNMTSSHLMLSRRYIFQHDKDAEIIVNTVTIYSHLADNMNSLFLTLGQLAQSHLVLSDVFG